MAQWIRRDPSKVKIAGSSPAWGVMNKSNQTYSYFLYAIWHIEGGLAQLVEHSIADRIVTGSIPVVSLFLIEYILLKIILKK